jgi:hypothetical protein
MKKQKLCPSGPTKQKGLCLHARSYKGGIAGSVFSPTTDEKRKRQKRLTASTAGAV